MKGYGYWTTASYNCLIKLGEGIFRFVCVRENIAAVDIYLRTVGFYPGSLVVIFQCCLKSSVLQVNNTPVGLGLCPLSLG